MEENNQGNLREVMSDLQSLLEPLKDVWSPLVTPTQGRWMSCLWPRQQDTSGEQTRRWRLLHLFLGHPDGLEQCLSTWQL